MSREDLEARILAWMREESWERDDERFDSLARELFAFQFHACAPYGRFCEARGVTPATLGSGEWWRIPAVPTGAFKEVALRCFRPEREVATFRTSGTTGASDARPGELHLDTLALYEASLLPAIRRHVFPDLAPGERMHILVLAPSAEEAPDSSLSHMFARALEALGTKESRFCVRDGELQRREIVDAIRNARDVAEPMAVCGTAFAFVHLLEEGGEHGGSRDELHLPAGSRVMETGGFKGRARAIPREELWERMASRFGVAEQRIVNQYGMTELGSQFYDSVLREPAAPRRKLGPPWVRVRLVDPTSDEDAPPGEPGLIAVHDLANTGSVAAVLTADLGVRVDAPGGESGFEVLGRQAGAEERGCSIAADLMLAG